MEELRAIFLRQIKNLPFIECVDENQFYDEFLNSPVETINQELILSEILKGKDISEIEKIIDDWYKRDDSNIDIKNGILKKIDINLKFNAKISEIIKSKNQNYYIPDITRTKTYQAITKINEVYTDFLFLISEKKKYKIVEGKSLNVIPESKIIYDRLSDPKIKAERILQILEYFNDDIQHRIIQKIINDDSYGLYLMTEKNNPNFQQTKDALENFRKYLHELDKKSNPKATQIQTIQEEIGGVIERTLTMKQIALKFVFEKKQITEQNKNTIAANYNWISKNSGEKLKREYDYFQKRNNRIGQIKDQTTKKQKNRIELFESVLPLLEGDTIEIQNEIEILKSKMENDDL